MNNNILNEIIDENDNINEKIVKDIVSKFMNIDFEKIKNVKKLKKGLTNISILFEYENKKYILRIPGKGSEMFINRKEEYNVYKQIQNKDICESIVYMNSETGIKITEFLENTYECDPLNKDDVRKCMNKLRQFHEMKLSVEHEFDLFFKIDYYESLLNGKKSKYHDYKETKENVLLLKNILNKYRIEKTLSHIDSLSDNFLLFSDKNKENDVVLIDWEFAGMQDPHVDIAMFILYAMYDRKQVDELIDMYFTEGCSKENRLKIYCYISICGLLWSNWCEYKESLGMNFGEYSLKQYEFAKDYYTIIQEEAEKM